MARTALFAIALLGAALLPAAGPHRDKWVSVANQQLKTAPESIRFDWGEGVEMIGMMKVHQRTGNAAYAEYVDQWARFHGAKPREELLSFHVKGREGFCGRWSPAAAILYLYQAQKKPEQLAMARMVLDFIRAGAERNPEGGLGHWVGSHQLWVDTVYMAAPVLAGFAMLDRKPEYAEDAARQIAVHARHLQDPASGLFYHMYDWKTGQRSAGLWGRGNGWILMSLADTFDALDKKSPDYAPMRKIALAMVRGLAKYQNADGLWHTVVDDAKSYEESSASAMAAYAILKMARQGVLPASTRKMALRAWDGINRKYVKDGVVTGVSAGTSPTAKEKYGQIKVGTETWGTGAYLMAGSEVDRLK